MATALHNGPAEAGAGLHASLYPRSFLTEFDLQDNRYPSLPSRSPRQNIPQTSTSPSGDITPYDDQSNTGGQSPSGRHSDQMDDVPLRTPELRPEPRNQEPAPSRRSARSPDTLSAQFLPSQSQDTQSYPSQEETPRREPEPRSSPQDNTLSAPVNRDTRPMSYQEPSRSNAPQALRLDGMDRPLSMLPNTPRHPDVALASASSASGQFAPIMPLSASPNYTPPVAPRNRTYPQQPTYINPANVSKPTYTPVAPPQEEVCLECAMRDQDMADVDVTGPGVWDRASDVLFEELKEREREEEVAGIVSSDEKRPRARGGKLTEQNLKLWLSINPREPASRLQTLNTYVRSQRAMLEAEAVAHAKAMKEAAQLDNRMRDTYSQLRRSAYDLGTSSTPADDTGGVRIKPPQTPTTPVHHSHTRSHSREVTLLENGMIVEHVDVRREEREARERRRKEEKRARKSSRSSVFDVTSIISAQSTGLTVDNTLKPRSAVSHTGPRPVSELTPNDRPEIPRAYSQASFSDVHSLGSGSSARRPKFFGMRNLSTGWRSQDSLAHSFAASGMSGSMVDMHVALQREDKRRTIIAPNPSSRLSAFWPNGDQSDPVSEEKAKKKKSGLIKWWRTVTGSNKPDSQSRNLPVEDDLPLAPPPPLSYLVDRGSPEVHVNGRQSSPPSVQSSPAPKFGQSITVPSPTAPSPPSPRGGNGDAGSSDTRTVYGYDDSRTEKTDDANSKRPSGSGDWKLHSVASEPNLRQSVISPEHVPPIPPLPDRLDVSRRTNSASREKSLPPIPTDEAPALPTIADRPMTMYAYDPRALPPGTRPPHDFLPPSAPFRNEVRRQSFSGTGSRPDLTIQTLPANPGNQARQTFGPQYDEFGQSGLSFNRNDYLEDSRRTTSPQPSSTTKRKSKFGFASLLGKKNQRDPENHSSQPFPSMGRYDETISGSFDTYRNSGRMSMMSRKPLDELVSQDREFVAYRYPSTEQRFDLLK